MNNCNVTASYYLLSFLVCVLLKFSSLQMLMIHNVNYNFWLSENCLYLVLLLPKGSNMCVALNFYVFF